MKPPIFLPSGPGPRRPERPAPTALASAADTDRRMTIPLADIRKIPRPLHSRVKARWYDIPAKRLPNGLPRTTPLVADAGLTLGDQFSIHARILGDGQGKATWLQLDRDAFDAVLRHDTIMPSYADAVLRGVFDTMCQQHLLAQARQSRRGYGRN